MKIGQDFLDILYDTYIRRFLICKYNRVIRRKITYVSKTCNEKDICLAEEASGLYVQ